MSGLLLVCQFPQDDRPENRHNGNRHLSATNWSTETDAATVAKRAGGRRHYNAVRTALAGYRQWRASQMLEQVGYLTKRGWQSELARRLGVHRSTICRDFSVYVEASRLGITVEEVEQLRRLRAYLDKRRSRGMAW